MNGMHGLTTAQGSPDLRFTPFLDDSALLTPSTTPANNPVAGLMNTVFHGPAGDLHTPTALSSLLAPKTLLEQFAVTPLHRNNTGNYNPIFDPQYFPAEPQAVPDGDQNAGYPPSAFVHSDLTAGFGDEPCEELSLASDLDSHEQSDCQLVSPEKYDSKSEETPNHSQSK